MPTRCLACRCTEKQEVVPIRKFEVNDFNVVTRTPRGNDPIVELTQKVVFNGKRVNT